MTFKATDLMASTFTLRTGPVTILGGFKVGKASVRALAWWLISPPPFSFVAYT